MGKKRQKPNLRRSSFQRDLHAAYEKGLPPEHDRRSQKRAALFRKSAKDETFPEHGRTLFNALEAFRKKRLIQRTLMKTMLPADVACWHESPSMAGAAGPEAHFQARRDKAGFHPDFDTLLSCPYPSFHDSTLQSITPFPNGVLMVFKGWFHAVSSPSGSFFGPETMGVMARGSVCESWMVGSVNATRLRKDKPLFVAKGPNPERPFLSAHPFCSKQKSGLPVEGRLGPCAFDEIGTDPCGRPRIAWAFGGPGCAEASVCADSLTFLPGRDAVAAAFESISLGLFVKPHGCAPQGVCDQSLAIAISAGLASLANPQPETKASDGSI